MGISEEESICCLIDEKSFIGYLVKWVVIIFVVYFVIMLFYQYELGVLILVGGIFVVFFLIWMKKCQKVKFYKD